MRPTFYPSAKIPPDPEIERVMAQTGMGKLQAINHLRCREAARDRMAARPRRF